MKKKLLILAFLFSMLAPKLLAYADQQTSVEITADVKKPNIYYGITITIVGNGNVYINKVSALPGDEIRIVAEPLAGNKFSHFEGCDSNRFLMPEHDISITVYFVLDNTTTPTPVHIHLWIEKNIVASCTNLGKSWEECSCGKIRNEKMIEPQGHWLSEWKMENDATCMDLGLKSRYCQRLGCSYIENKVVDSMGHTEIYGGTKYSHKECSKCSFIVSSEHTFTKETIFVDTYTEAAEYKYSCYCGYAYIEKGEVSEHKPYNIGKLLPIFLGVSATGFGGIGCLIFLFLSRRRTFHGIFSEEVIPGTYEKGNRSEKWMDFMYIPDLAEKVANGMISFSEYIEILNECAVVTLFPSDTKMAVTIGEDVITLVANEKKLFELLLNAGESKVEVTFISEKTGLQYELIFHK